MLGESLPRTADARRRIGRRSLRARLGLQRGVVEPRKQFHPGRPGKARRAEQRLDLLDASRRLRALQHAPRVLLQPVVDVLPQTGQRLHLGADALDQGLDFTRRRALSSGSGLEGLQGVGELPQIPEHPRDRLVKPMRARHSARGRRVPPHVVRRAKRQVVLQLNGPNDGQFVGPADGEQAGPLAEVAEFAPGGGQGSQNGRSTRAGRRRAALEHFAARKQSGLDLLGEFRRRERPAAAPARFVGQQRLLVSPPQVRRVVDRRPAARAATLTDFVAHAPRFRDRRQCVGALLALGGRDDGLAGRSVWLLLGGFGLGLRAASQVRHLQHIQVLRRPCRSLAGVKEFDRLALVALALLVDPVGDAPAHEIGQLGQSDHAVAVGIRAAPEPFGDEPGED